MKALPCLLLLVGLTASTAREARAQCELVTGPTPLICALCNSSGWDPPENFNSGAGWLGLYRTSGGDRLLAPMAWGTVTYGLANPAGPTVLAVYDLRAESPGPGTPGGDGQSYGSGYGISSDGQRALYSLKLPPGETVVSVPSGESFTPMGSTGLSSAIPIVQVKGSRYLAYGLDSNGAFVTSDITTLTGYHLPPPIPSEAPALFPTGTMFFALAEGNGESFLSSVSTAGVTLVDVSSPGPIGSITSEFVSKSIPSSAFGLAGQYLVGVSVAVDPATGKLYVLGSFHSSGGFGATQSFSLLLYDPGTSSSTLVGTFTSPDPVFSGSAGLDVGALAVNPFTAGVTAFMWFGGSTFGTSRLYATSVEAFGSAIPQWTDISGPVGGIGGNRLLFKSATETYLYFVDGNSPWVMQLSCQGASAPDAGLADGGGTDAGGASPDGGVANPDADAATGGPASEAGGCGCVSAPGSSAPRYLAALFIAALSRRRKRA